MQLGKTYSPALDTDIANGEVITAQVSTAAAAIGSAAQDQCAFTSAGVSITIAPGSAAQLTSDKVLTSQTICSGDTVVFTATGAGAGVVTYTFRAGSVAGSGATLQTGPGTTYSQAFTTSGSVNLEAETSGGCKSYDVLDILMPVITAGGSIALNDADLLLCGTVAIPAFIANDSTSVVASSTGSSPGTVITYQWEIRNGVSGSWSPISGATSSTGNLDVSASPVSVEQNKQIRRAAYATLNGVTCSVVYSTNNISINVEADRNPVVTVGPSATVCLEGVSDLVFTLTTTNDASTDTYAWYKNGALIAGAIGKTYSPALDTDIANGEVITAQVSTAAAAIGSAAQDQCAFTSAGVSITIAPGSAAQLTSDKVLTSQTICSGDTVVFTATGAGAGVVTYTFRAGAVAGSGATLQTGPGTTYSQAFTTSGSVNLEAETSGGCKSYDVLDILMPVITAGGSIALNDADLLLCGTVAIPAFIANDSTSVVASSTGSSPGTVITYQWEIRNGVSGSWSPISGATSSTGNLDVSASPVSVEQNKQIRRAAYATLNGVTCSVVYSTNNISINVEADRNPVVTVGPSATVCLEGVSDLVFTLTTTNDASTDTYAWYKNGALIAGAIGKTYSPALDTDIANGEVITAQVSTAAAAIGSAAQDFCAFTSAPVAITISSVPTAQISSTAVGNIICGGNPGGAPFADTVTFTANLIAGASYQFFNGAGAPLTANVVNGNTFTTDDFSETDTDLQFTVTVRITNVAGCFDEASMVISMNYVIADGGSITGGTFSQNICSGTAPNAFVGLGVQENPDGVDDFADGADYPNGTATVSAVISYQWQNKVGAGIWQDIIGATVSSTYQAPALFNTTQYRRQSISTLNGVECIENSSSIITINVATALTGGVVERNTGGSTFIDATQILCPGDIPQLLRVDGATPAAADINFQWEFSADSVTWYDILTTNTSVTTDLGITFPFNATGETFQPQAITEATISSVHSMTVTGTTPPLVAGDFYRVSIGVDVFTVTIGEDGTAAGGDNNVNNIDEVLVLLAYKINNSGTGITAVQSGTTDNITLTLAPGSTLTPVWRFDDATVDVTFANYAFAQTYNGQSNTRFYKRRVFQNFGGAVPTPCAADSDIHQVTLNTLEPGRIANSQLLYCDSSIPLQFTSIRDAYSPTLGAITYQWQQTTDVAQTVWQDITTANGYPANETAIDFSPTRTITQTTSFRRRAFSTLGGVVCDDIDNSVTNVVQLTILDEVSSGNILASQEVCQILGAPLTVLVGDLVNIVATGVETDRGTGDAVIYQWQFSADNNIWYNVLTNSVSASTNILGTASFTADLNGTTITAAQQKADIEKYLAAQVDPDLLRIIYYRLKTTRVNDIDDSGAQNGTESTCEVFSAASPVSIFAQPTLVQTTAPLGGQTVCITQAVIPITFQWGGSANWNKNN